MRGIVFLLLLVFLPFQGYGYQSAYLQAVNENAESDLITNADAYSLAEGSLIACGVPAGAIAGYIDRLRSVYTLSGADLEPDKTEKARLLFDTMHDVLLKKYQDESTSPDQAIAAGLFNCLSSTIIYCSLLEMAGIPYEGIILPAHAYASVNINGTLIDVECTSPGGFNIGDSPSAQSDLKRLTGITYQESSKISERVGKKGLIGYLYSNRSYFFALKRQTGQSFQSAVKSAAVYPQGQYIQTNLIPAYSDYAKLLVSRLDYSGAAALMKEGLINIPSSIMTNNYIFYTDQAVQYCLSKKDIQQAFILYKDAYRLTGRESFKLRESFYYNLLNTAAGSAYPDTAFTYAMIYLDESPDAKERAGVMARAVRTSSEKLRQDYSTGRKKYPDSLFLVTNWITITGDSIVYSEVENFYNQLLIDFTRTKDYDLVLDAAVNGLNLIPSSKILRNNLIVSAVNAGVISTQAGDYRKGLGYIDRVLLIIKDDKTLLEARLNIYLLGVYQLIQKKDYKASELLARDGLKYYPENEELNKFLNYILQNK